MVSLKTEKTELSCHLVLVTPINSVMLQCSAAVSQRAWKRQFFRFPSLCFGLFFLGDVISLAMSSMCLHWYCHACFVQMCSNTDLNSNDFYQDTANNIFYQVVCFFYIGSSPFRTGTRHFYYQHFLGLLYSFPPNISDSFFSIHVHSDNMTTGITRPE